ncbi:esterase-like activity of phytase family protein [Phytohabitans flavus]|nr:esterase-like activity of phytase family protein [Phytohabitans flavus]
MKRKHMGPLAAGVLVASMLPSMPASAHGNPSHGGPGPFGRIATIPAYLNSDITDDAAAEIAAVSSDGRTVIYTDSPGERLGFIDITDSSRPKPSGVLELAGEPTSVATFGKYVLAAVNTRESFTNPSGQLVVVDAKTRAVVRTLDLGGQPDSVAVAPSGKYIAIAIENERDEDVDDGAIPQLPAGWLSVVDTRTWSVSKVDLTGLAAVAPEDPEPEYVSINRDDEAVVSLQENNHLAVVRLRDRKVVKHFSAGSVTVSNVDTKDDDNIVLDGTVTAKREPDGVAWLDDNLFATANEGDYEGGSRGFSIFDKRTGRPVFDSGNALDRLAVAHGLYPDNRSDAKGVEPENVAVGTFGGTPYLFVNAERGNFVAVYDVRKPWAPRFVQLMPAVNGPEGVVTAPSRGLVVVSSEEDMPDEGIRSSVQLYKFGAKTDFPSIVSTNDIGWGALSGLSPVPGKRDRLVSVTDSVYEPTRLLTIDTGDKPAKITSALTVTKDGEPVGYDAEGVAARAGGGYWLGVEGTGPTGNPNLLVRLHSNGAVAEEVPLPADVAAAITSNGIEGVAVTGSGSKEQVWVAIQRELTGDQKGLVRIGRYSVASKTWAWLAYPLDAAPAGAWVGLSELVVVDHNTFAVIERDNQRGPAAKVKKVYTFDVPGAFGTGLPVVKKRLAIDLLPLLQAGNGWTQDKVEGLTIGGDGRTYAVTDNDGVDESTGETVFMRLGKLL